MARAARAAVVITLAAMGVAAAGGCASFPATFCEYGFCTEGADAATDAGGGTVPPGCDTPTEPAKNAEKCFVDSFGAYVSPAGKDTNPGTRAAPFKTIAKALTSGKPRVVVCEGEYNESVELTSTVEVYGKVACTFDRGGGATKVKGAKPDYAVRVFRTANVRLADLEIEAAPGVASAPGSYGVVIADSTGVSLVRLRVDAKDGAAGADGVLAPYTFPEPVPASIPGRGESGACPGGATSQGGQGGATDLASGGDGLPRPSAGTSGKGAGANCGSLAQTGADGATGPNGGSALKVGEVTGAGWQGTSGSPGAPGFPGGGGGGGGYTTGDPSAIGGGGAAGGCGGAGGGGGGAGGSSIALVMYASDVTLDTCALRAGAPGAGGAGATTSQEGQPGSAALTTGAACTGAAGGRGGPGGLGGGGAGGSSVGLAWTGTEPKFIGTTTVVRAETGAPAPGGAGASGAVGVKGVNVDVLKAP